MQETLVQFLGLEDPLQEGMATHSSILIWRIPMDRGAWWDTVHGIAKSQTWWATKHSTAYIYIRYWYNNFVFATRLRHCSIYTVNKYLFFLLCRKEILFTYHFLLPCYSDYSNYYERKREEKQEETGWSIWEQSWWLRLQKLLGRERIQEGAITVWENRMRKVGCRRYFKIWCCELGAVCSLLFSGRWEQRLKLLAWLSLLVAGPFLWRLWSCEWITVGSGIHLIYTQMGLYQLCCFVIPFLSKMSWCFFSSQQTWISVILLSGGTESLEGNISHLSKLSPCWWMFRFLMMMKVFIYLGIFLWLSHWDRLFIPNK